MASTTTSVARQTKRALTETEAALHMKQAYAHNLNKQITTALCLLALLLLVTPHNMETHLISLRPIVRPGPSLF